MPTQTDVLVLGAGGAGLAASAKLAAAGLSVILLEARDRLGGRIHTQRVDGWPAPIEAGPEFVHGHGTPLDALLKLSHLPVARFEEQHWKAQGRVDELRIDNQWQRIFQRLNDYDGPDCSFADFLAAHCRDVSPEAQKFAIDYVEGFNAADQGLIGVHWLKRSEEQVGVGSEDNIVRLPGGYDQLLAALPHPHVQIQLNSVVTEIHWQSGNVVATIQQGDQFQARAAIVTLPLGVLQASAVRFTPDVQKQNALAGLQMGPVVKILLHFREPLFPEVGEFGFVHTPNEPFAIWWPHNDPRVLAGWSGGAQTEPLLSLSAEQIHERAVAILSQARGVSSEELSSRVVDHRVFEWQSDPLSRGAYSYAKVGGANAAAELAAPLANTLFFAGEATEPALSGTVAGALASGERAAREVLAALNR